MSSASEPRRRSLSARIRWAFLTLGLVAIALTGWQGYRVADEALETAAYERLTAIRETKKRQIEGYFAQVVRTVETLARGEVALDALQGFEAALADDSGDDFRAVEALHGEALRGYVDAFGFEDLILVRIERPSTVYSAGGQEQAGATARGGLAALVSRMLEEGAGGARVEDFAPYPDAGGAPAAFAAVVIEDRGQPAGILAVRLSAAPIDRVMTGGGAWREEGLGESGETYLVGADGWMRSDSRFYLEDPAGYFERQRAAGLAAADIERLRRAGTTVLTQEVRTEAFERAMSGEADTSRVRDYRGAPVLSSFTPLSLPDLDWVMLSEIDEAEVFRPIGLLRNRLLSLALAVSAVFLGVGYWFSRKTTGPLHALASEIDAIRESGLSRQTQLAGFAQADDEIARLAERFGELTERLRETTVSRDYLDNLLRSMLNAVLVVRETDEGAAIQSVNQAACKLLASDQLTLQGKMLSEIVGSGAARPEWLERLRAQGAIPPIEKTLIDSSGRRIPVLFTAALLESAGGAPVDVVCVAQDITDLRAAEERLRVLARKLLVAQEEERSRVARELHDDVTQRLGLLAIEAGKLERSSDVGATPKMQAAELKERAIELSEDVQQLSRRLHPAILRDLGLAAALRSECTALSKRLDTPVSLAADDLPPGAPPEARLALYRIAQEALHNIARHADATEINVELSVWDDRVVMTVADDGRGFLLADKQGRGGLGLASMEERAKLAGGRMAVVSKPGEGTTIRVEVPLEAATS